jgi:DNA repair exonuclease SbcCD nuclease subunit
MKILFLSDTHLGYDAPLRPQIERRRRGDDFYENYLTALKPAFDAKVDLVVHGGDMFFRSRVHASIVQKAFAPLLRLADSGMPVFIVPGNHERSNIPQSLLERHPGIFVFHQPITHIISLRGHRIAIAGFANIRQDPRSLFKDELLKTGWNRGSADVRLLCMHQAVEGAQVGVQNFTFRSGADVIRGSDIPPGLHAVLSGHIHRHQILTQDLVGRKLAAPVFYPGSTERTSFAEREETKGYLILAISPQEKNVIKYKFVPLQARPMVDLDVAVGGYSLDQVRETLVAQIAALDSNAIVRVRAVDGGADAIVRALNDRWLRSVAPASMNIEWSFAWKGKEGEAK